MNDPAATPVDIEEQRNWLIDHRKTSGASWAELSKRVNLPQGTLSQFGSDRGYSGDEERLAQAIYRYRQLLASQAAIQIDAPEAPGFFETETSRQLTHFLSWAQRGKVVVAALGPGLGKSRTAAHYQACFPNVFVATMTPSTAGVANMQAEVLEAMGEHNTVGTPQKLSRRVRERASKLRHPLIVIDEAQHLSANALEEIRSWNDLGDIGIALFGNIGVLQRIESFAQLSSRASLKVKRNLPLRADIDAQAAAWNIHDDTLIAALHKICAVPGGLRNGTMSLELASMIAASEKTPLAAPHLQDAWAQLSSRSVL